VVGWGASRLTAPRERNRLLGITTSPNPFQPPVTSHNDWTADSPPPPVAAMDRSVYSCEVLSELSAFLIVADHAHWTAPILARVSQADGPGRSGPAGGRSAAPGAGRSSPSSTSLGRSELFGVGILFQQVDGGHILVEKIEPGCSAARSSVIQVNDECVRVDPSPRTKWTRRVPHSVLIGHAASLTPY